MKFFFIASFFLAVAYCFWENNSVHYEQIADNLTAKTAKKLEKEKKLLLVGIGGGMMNDIKKMSMSFDYYNEVNIDKARQLLIYANNKYLADINNSKKIRPYLHNYPFTNKNVEIIIFFYNPKGFDVSNDKISVAAVDEGELTYYIKPYEKKPIKVFYEENYEEAIQIVSSSP